MPESITFLVVTGVSGAGKSFAIKCLEDMGFFCVDNLPTTLMPTFADLIVRSQQSPPRVALGVDVRAGEYLTHLIEAIDELRARGHRVETLFLEASDEALVRRYHETRRRHPLAGDGQVLDGILAERKALANLREIADRKARRAHLPPFQDISCALRRDPPTPGSATRSYLVGFKHGFHRRRWSATSGFCPSQGGRAAHARRPGRGVSEFSQAQESRELLLRLEDLLDFCCPPPREGKAYLTVAIGCTGGHHRSVSFVEALRRFLDQRGFPPSVVHRDMGRE